MNESRQRAYLDAMDIPVWTLRHAGTSDPVSVECELSLKLGPGNGGILLICSNESEPASKLASDLARSLGTVPVWSWPDSGAESIRPAAAVDKSLFTTVAVFGTELAEQFFGRQLPASLGSANLVLLPSIRDLQTNAEARKTLWSELCRSGMVSAN